LATRPIANTLEAQRTSVTNPSIQNGIRLFILVSQRVEAALSCLLYSRGRPICQSPVSRPTDLYLLYNLRRSQPKPRAKRGTLPLVYLPLAPI